MKFDYIRNPLQVNDFIKRHGTKIKDKNIIYTVQTNHKSDARNVKVGKSEKGLDRLKSYQNILGNKSKDDPHSGLKIKYVEIVPKRKVGQSGKKLLELKENKLKQDLKKHKVAGRGSEVFQVTSRQLSKALSENKPKAKYEPQRKSERIRKCVKWEIKNV